MHVAVTGASSGIGEAIAREFGRAGHKITVVARRRELLEKIAASIGNGTHVAVHDLSDSANAAGWIAAAEKAHGPIDVLVNNAGIENTGPTASSDIAVGVKVLRTNLETPLVLIRTVLPAMIARKSGILVNVASVAALVPTPQQTWYGASKAGLAAFSESLRGELRTTGVRVLTVYPGPVTTAMGEAAYAAFGGRKGIVGMVPEGRPDVLARRIRRSVERRRARLIYPLSYVPSRFVPWFARVLVDLLTPSAYPKAT